MRLVELGKKEHAQRILDALDTSKRLRKRLIIVVFSLVVLGVVAFSQGFNLTLIIGVELLLFVFLSFSVDRERQSIEYNLDLGFKKLGWTRPEEIDENTTQNLLKIIGDERR